jgi:hypothetical protein
MMRSAIVFTCIGVEQFVGLKLRKEDVSHLPINVNFSD